MNLTPEQVAELQQRLADFSVALQAARDADSARDMQAVIVASDTAARDSAIAALTLSTATLAANEATLSAAVAESAAQGASFAAFLQSLLP